MSGALLAWSLIPLTMVAVRVALNGGEMTWADAHEPQDSFQYFAWIRDAGEHVLIANRFDIAPAAHSSCTRCSSCRGCSGASGPRSD